MSDPILEFLQQLTAGGVTFIVNLDAVWGGQDHAASAHQIRRWLADREAVEAELWGVTVEQYRDWRAHRQEGIPCGQPTTTGRPCRKVYAGFDADCSPTGWIEAKARGWRCHLHQTDKTA